MQQHREAAEEVPPRPTRLEPISLLCVRQYVYLSRNFLQLIIHAPQLVGGIDRRSGLLRD